MFSTLSNVEVLALLIPIVAIIVGGVVAVVKILIRHNERMAMIQQGMHPDHFKSPDIKYGDSLKYGDDLKYREEKD